MIRRESEVSATHRVATAWLGGVLAVLVLASCQRDGSDVGPGPLGTTGSTRVLLTDDPFPFSRVARVDLYVVSVSGSLSADTSVVGGSFVTLATPSRRINVLALQNGVTDEIGRLTLPTGAITAVRMVIDTDSSSITLSDGRVLTGKSTPGIAWQSSGGRPTLNALIHEQIAVPDSGAIVVVDYDVGNAFITPQQIDPASTDQGFIFSPVLHAADGRRTGHITGTVRARTESGAPVASASLQLYLGNPSNAENTWSRLATARSDSTGAFRFAWVTRSAFWSGPASIGRTYIVTADPPAGTSLGRRLVTGITVTAGATEALGTLVLP